MRDGQGRLLMVRRGHPPGEGLWSVPGGRVEPGESDAAAVARELLEETGLVVSVGALAGVVERPGPDGVTFVIRDYAATAVGGVLRAGDDAADARWVSVPELGALPLTPGLLEALREWGMLPSPPAGTPGRPEAPGTPGTPGTTEAPGTDEAPGAPGSPGDGRPPGTGSGS